MGKTPITNSALMAALLLGLLGTTYSSAQDCEFSSVPERTLMERSIYGTNATLLWSEAPNATAYTLFYAPFSDPIDASTLNNISTVDLGNSTHITAVLPMGSNFYVALQPTNCAGTGPVSNYQTLNINDQASTSLLDISLTFSGKVNSTEASRDFTDADKALFFQAVEIWQKAIRGVSGLTSSHNLAITVSVPSTLPGDGAASVSETTSVGENILPIAGELQINGAKYDANYLDPANYTQLNRAEDLANIVHEIGHILGIGPLWSDEIETLLPIAPHWVGIFINKQMVSPSISECSLPRLIMCPSPQMQRTITTMSSLMIHRECQQMAL
jgi:hypothetical protein